MVKLEKIWIDRTEVTVGAFAEFVDQTNLITQAEASGGGMVYEWGWTQKQDWTWRTPYGAPADPNEPAVHITYDEAEAFCAWSGKRLPTEAEWIEAAYTEQREKPETGFENGITYPFPTGRTPEGANCLEGCGATPNIEVEADLDRGRGHAKVGMTQPGVNGLYDMGANVWEWVQIGDGSNQGTRGGSWWYGVGQMRADHYATKPRDMAAVYIGFRCVRSK